MYTIQNLTRSSFDRTAALDPEQQQPRAVLLEPRRKRLEVECAASRSIILREFYRHRAVALAPLPGRSNTCAPNSLTCLETQSQGNMRPGTLAHHPHLCAVCCQYFIPAQFRGCSRNCGRRRHRRSGRPLDAAQPAVCMSMPGHPSKGITRHCRFCGRLGARRPLRLCRKLPLRQRRRARRLQLRTVLPFLRQPRWLVRAGGPPLVRRRPAGG